MKKILTALLALTAFSGAQVLAETEKPERDGKHRPRCEEIREAKKENRTAKREHHRQQRLENREFREGLAELEPDARISAILAHRIEQYGENEAFHQERFNNITDAIQNCDELPDDKKAEILEKITSHFEEAKAFHHSIHQEVVDFLSELKASDLPPEEKMEALKEFHEEIREEVRAWREEHRPDREGRREKRRGNDFRLEAE